MTDGASSRVHFVWIGRRFPYHCRLAVESAIVAMPDAEVELHVMGPRPDDGHFRAVVEYPQVTLVPWEQARAFEACPIGPAAYRDLVSRIPASSPAAISNLLRLVVLYQRGGVYLDTDVIVLSGLADPDEHGVYVGVERVWAQNRSRVTDGLALAGAVRAVPWAAAWLTGRLDVALTRGRIGVADRTTGSRRYRLQVNNAVIGSPPGSRFVERALERALEVDPSVRFALGPSLLDDVAQESPEHVSVAPTSRFYAVPPGESHRLFGDRCLELPPDAQVIHYVASNHRRLLSGLDVDDPRFQTRDEPFWSNARRVRESIAKIRSVSSTGSGQDRRFVVRAP